MTHVDHHVLAQEFPDLADKIHELKVGDAHFAHLFDEYSQLDKEICRAEDGIPGENMCLILSWMD